MYLESGLYILRAYVDNSECLNNVQASVHTYLHVHVWEGESLWSVEADLHGVGVDEPVALEVSDDLQLDVLQVSLLCRQHSTGRGRRGPEGGGGWRGIHQNNNNQVMNYKYNLQHDCMYIRVM